MREAAYFNDVSKLNYITWDQDTIPKTQHAAVPSYVIFNFYDVVMAKTGLSTPTMAQVITVILKKTLSHRLHNTVPHCFIDSDIQQWRIPWDENSARKTLNKGCILTNKVLISTVFRLQTPVKQI